MSVVNKYNNGKVYRIWSPSRTDLVYYGSTVNDLAKRLYHHKDKYKRHKEGKGKGKYTTSFNIFDQCSDYRIELVESFACNNRNELTAREGFYIRNNECVNKYVAGRTKKEYYQDNRDKKIEHANKYYHDNRDKRIEKMKEYREANAEALKDQRKQWYQVNKEAVKEQRKQFYEEHKEQYIQYRAANKEVINKKQRERREANKDAINEKKRQYRAEHKERINARRRELRLLKKNKEE
jgi:hypothetical protein